MSMNGPTGYDNVLREDIKALVAEAQRIKTDFSAEFYYHQNRQAVLKQMVHSPSLN